MAPVECPASITRWKPQRRDEGDHRAQVLDALREALEGRAGEVGAPARDHVVAAGVDLEVADAGRGEPGRQLADQRLPEENTEPRPCTQTSAERRRRRGLGHDAVEPDAVARCDADQRGGDAERPGHVRHAPDFREWSRGPGRRERGGHLPYTPAVITSQAVADNLTKASWIRRMFEEGARLKQERGADKVFDFTLGNPEIEPPPAVLAAARRVLDSNAPHLHAYMPNAGHPRVREAVAGAARGRPPGCRTRPTTCS